MKNSLTPARIEPATIRFVAQHLNHWATAVRTCRAYYSEINWETVHLVGFTVKKTPSPLQMTICMLNQSVSVTTITFVYDSLVTFNRWWSLYILLSFKADSKQLNVHLLDISTAKCRHKQLTEHTAFYQLFSQTVISFSWTLKGFLYAKSHLLLFPPRFV